MTEKLAKRTLTTIFYADVVGYSRLTGLDEEGTHNPVMATLDYISQKINSSGGSVLRYSGDAILATFPSVVLAIEISTEVQNKLAEDNEPIPKESRVYIRVGINLGDVIEDRGEVFGDGVNLAARLEAAAEPGGICISSMVWEQCRGKIKSTFVDGGEQQFKNISRPVRTFNWKSNVDRPNIDLPNNDNPLPDKPSIAVLPFDNMSGDPEQEYLADGISEDIITALSKIRSFLVIARNSTFTYKNRAVDVVQVAGELNVGYVLEGSLRTAGKRVRVTAQLIDASNGHHVWAEKYDRELDDIFVLQDEMTQTIAGALEPELNAAERERAISKPPQNLNA